MDTCETCGCRIIRCIKCRKIILEEVKHIFVSASLYGLNSDEELLIEEEDQYKSLNYCIPCWKIVRLEYPFDLPMVATEAPAVKVVDP